MRTFLSRREILRFAGAAGIAGGIAPLYASDSGFWNKKDPADWTGAEIDQLTNKSPWAKQITVTAPAEGYGRGYPGGGYPGGGYPVGIGFPGGMGRRRGPGMPAGQVYKAVVRWQSAKVILDAMKTPLPEKMTNHYVIVVGGIPVNPRDNRYGSNDDSAQSNQEILDRMKAVTFLQPKDKRDLQPGVIVQQPANYGDVYFGFARDLVTLRPEDKEVVFSTSFGRIPVKVKFNLREMMYHGELSV